MDRLAPLCREGGIHLVLLLSRKSPTHAAERTVADALPELIIPVYRSKFRPAAQTTPMSFRTPIVAVPVTPEEARAGEAEVAGLRVPTVETWVRAVERLRGALARALPPPSRAFRAFRAYRRQFAEVLQVDALEAWDVVATHVPRIDMETAWTIYVVVFTLYRISQRTGLPGETFPDLYNAPRSTATVLRGQVARVLAAGHLQRRALVLDIVFGQEAEPIDLAWTSVHAVARAIVAPESAPEFRVQPVPRLLDPRDLVEAVRSLSPGTGDKIVYHPGDGPQTLRREIAEVRAGAQEVTSRVLRIAIAPLEDAASFPRHACLACFGPTAVCPHGDSILPMLCPDCAGLHAPELQAINVGQRDALGDALRAEIVELELRATRAPPWAFPHLWRACAARHRLLEEVTEMEARIAGGAFHFNPFLSQLDCACP